MNDQNLNLYNDVRSVPDEAKKPITAGRIKGFIDINPMWRIKTLTNQFGPCGSGWYYEITDKWIDDGPENQKTANIQINLYVKQDSEWSKAIPGLGGSQFITKEKNGLYMSKEAYKMALTDSLSVACKALGIGADVYFSNDARNEITEDEKDADRLILDEVSACETVEQLEKIYMTNKDWISNQNILIAACSKRKQELL